MDDQQNAFFRQHGSDHPKLIGEGMEGVVYDLGNGLVGKVWFHRSQAELLPLLAFHQELTAQQLPFRTPEITEIVELSGQAVSIEPKLPGTPLSTAQQAGFVTEEQGLDTFVQIVAALGKTVAGQPSKDLAVLDQPAGLWQLGSSWGEGLAGLVRLRAGDPLREAVPDFDTLLDRLLPKLIQLAPAELKIVHGDICTPNLLVDSDGQVSALLDWGFFTTAGDNTFDAATAAGFYDMYGPGARAADDLLLDRFESELGHSRELMLLYRAAYAVTTATIFNADGSDGHFAWCVANLHRDDIRAAVLD